MSGQTIQGALEAASKRLKLAGIDQPGLDARLLLAHVLGVGQAKLISDGNVALSEEDQATLSDALTRRAGGQPVSRIIGRRGFYGRDFVVTPAVLDPRADTEALIEHAFLWAKERTVRLLDLGVGSGAIILTLLAELPGATGVGVDISAEALAIAAENAARLGLSERVRWVCSDWDTDLEETFDLIVSNPPYIATDEIGSLAKDVKDHDPHLALDGGADGLFAFRCLADAAIRRLARGGAMIVGEKDPPGERVSGLFCRCWICL
ncbi:UNVERIFIED_CONTAM: hypothetical protein GTU68_040709 [Idotea baltica]|nr:hypothetical protein [Idotea baltica]